MSDDRQSYSVVAHVGHAFDTEADALEWAKARAAQVPGVRFIVVEAAVAVEVSADGATRVFRDGDDAGAIEP